MIEFETESGCRMFVDQWRVIAIQEIGKDYEGRDRTEVVVEHRSFYVRSDIASVVDKITFARANLP